MQNITQRTRPPVHLAIDLDADHVSGLAYFNPEYAYRLPLDVDAFSTELYRFGLSTMWIGRADSDLDFVPTTSKNASVIASGQRLLTHPKPNDWLGTKKLASALSNLELRKKLLEWKTKSIILTGLSIEACVTDTAKQLLQLGIDCILPLDLVAGYMGTAPYGSPEFQDWNRIAIQSILEETKNTLDLRGTVTLTTSTDILATIRQQKRPAPTEPASVDDRRAG